MHRRVEVRDLARMVRIVDVEHTQAGQDERARDDARVVSLRNGAVVSGVPLERAARPGITGDLRTGGSSVVDPAGCTSPCTRTQASATVKSPIVGSFTYTITYGGALVASVTTAVDLGTLQAQSTYKAAPSAG